ncbi:MAG: WD40 repeat domain-containing protein [Chloroflexi bacterium]|nr:WD40 repeat domain-containing protein [Chloroflexota bacterium]
MNKSSKIYAYIFGALLLVIMICLVWAGIRALQRNSLFKPTLLAAQIHFPYDLGIPLQKMTVQNIESLAEVRQFSDKEKSGMLRISLPHDERYLQAVTQDGSLITWDIAKGDEIARHEVGAVHVAAVSFSADGRRLSTPYNVTSDGRISGVVVWDTKTGVIIFCNGVKERCPEKNLMGSAILGETIDGVFLDATGEWLVEYYIRRSTNSTDAPRWPSYRPSYYEIYGVSKYYDEGTFTGAEDLNYDPPKYSKDPNAEVVAITTDIEAKYIAFAYANGVVRFRSLYDITDYQTQNYTLDYEQALGTERISVVEMKMDNTRTWLAVLNNKELLVWNLQRGKVLPLAIRKPASNGVALSFDQTGNLLAVARRDEILFYDLRAGKQVWSMNAKGVTSLIISPDNRFLVWGDTEGNLHLWGISEK